MHPILFSVGPIVFYTYGLCVSLAFITAILIFHFGGKQRKLWDKTTLNKLTIVCLSILIFARLTFFVEYYRDFSNWYEAFFVWQGGLVSYGGIAGMLLTFTVLFRKDIRQNLDILAISVLGGGIFWRLGGILSGSYPTVNSSLFSINRQFPAIEIEIILILLGLICSYFLFTKEKFMPGNIFFLTLSYYGIIRLVLDHFRIYSDHSSFLNAGQIGGLLLLAISLSSIFFQKEKRAKV